MLTLLVPELKSFYGSDLGLELFAELRSNDENTIHIDATKGMILGDHDSAKFNL